MKGVKSMSNDPKDAVVDLSKLMKGWQDSNSSEVQIQDSSDSLDSSDSCLIISCNESANLMGYEACDEIASPIKWNIE